MKKNGFMLKINKTKKKQEADTILQKLLWVKAMQIIKHFLQIHQLKLNICCMIWSRQQEALVSTWTQIKQSSYISIKMVSSPH